MKRLLAVALFAGLLSACAGVTAPGATKSQEPKQSLSDTGKAMGALRAAKFDVSGTIKVTLPQALVDQLKTKGGSQAGVLSSNMIVDLKISGVAQRPDQLQATVSAKLRQLTIQTEVIATGGNLYYKNPMNSKWEVLKKAGANGGTESKSSGAKLSYQTLLDTATSVTEINDSSSAINGTDHYRVVPDLAKLFDQASAGHASSNAAATSILKSILEKASLTADVWTGTSDHLIRGLSYEASVSADLSQLSAAFASQAGSASNGSQRTPAFSLPAGSTAQVTAHIVIDLHELKTQLNIKAPTVTG